MVIAALVAPACGDGDRARTATTGPVPTAPVATASTSTSATPDRQALLDHLRTSFGAPGAVAVLRHGDSLWAGYSGSADVTGTELTDESRFRIGSITKSIVATLMLGEVERGTVSLDDSVADLLPGVLRPEPRISVRMLLDHSSGLFNVGDEGDVIADIAKLADPATRAEAEDVAARYLAGKQVIVPDRLFVALAETHDLYFEPGTGTHYSNVNYQLAGMVLAKVSGTSVADLLRTRIVAPLGLRHTTLAPEDARSPEMRGYRVDAGESALTDVTDDFLAVGNGASGGVISTAEEVLTIMQAIVSGRLMDPLLVRDMKDATVESGGSYGLGVATYYLSCGRFFGHGGSIDGTQSIAIVNDNGTSGVVLAINLRKDSDPDLIGVADALLCA